MSTVESASLLGRREFRAYMGCLGAFWLPGGILTVLFPWLVAIELDAPAQQLGLAQMALQLPTLLLVLFGGVLADRLDPRNILLAVHLLAPLPPLTLAMALVAGEPGLFLLVVFALASGTFAALAMPARDTLLTNVAGDQIQRAVGLSMGLQFGVQIAGYGLASLADLSGPVPLLLLMALIMASGTLAVRALPRRITREPPSERGIGEILGGISVSVRSDELRPPMLLAFGTGIFYAGSFVVLLPLLIRDVYAGSAAGIGATFACFMLGTLTSILGVVRGERIRRQGRALVLSQIVAAFVLASAALQLPLPGFLLAIYLWGMCGGLGMVMSRSIVQEAAPASHRGRVLGVYSLTSFGGMPLGALLLGYIAALVGPLHAVLVPAVAMLVATVLITATSGIWRQGD